MTNEIAKLVVTKPDAERAEEFKQRLVEAYSPILQLLDEVDAAGFECQIQTTKGALGKQMIAQLRIVKVY